jgi:hypothetical protein
VTTSATRSDVPERLDRPDLVEQLMARGLSRADAEGEIERLADALARLLARRWADHQAAQQRVDAEGQDGSTVDLPPDPPPPELATNVARPPDGRATGRP